MPRSVHVAHLLCTVFLVTNAIAQPFQRPIATRAELDATSPTSPNPYVAYLPAGVEADYRYWDAWLRFRGENLLADRKPRARGGVVAESEPNDVDGDADPLVGFGAVGSSVTVSATVDPPAAGTPTVEENGSVVHATLQVVPAGQRVQVSSTIGDGAYGATSGDFDVYGVEVAAGGVLRFETLGSTDTYCQLMDATGAWMFSNRSSGEGDNCAVTYTIGSTGIYYVMIGGDYSGGFVSPSDPYDDPSSGPGVRATGPYDLIIGVDFEYPVDQFSMTLQQGDVVAFATDVAAQLAIYGPSGTLWHGTQGWDLSAIQPIASPLPIGPSMISIVVSESGLHRLRVEPKVAAGTAYSVSGVVERSPADAEGRRQIVFLDFDGATGVPVQELFEGQGPVSADLSPLADFLAGWGFGPTDEDALIDAVIARVESSLQFLEPKPVYELRNSRDHADPFGGPDATRIIVGGTTAELGIYTLGIAETIDVGNFELAETAVVLLDLLSGPSTSPDSLNQYLLAPGASKIDQVAYGLGSIVAHEAGHLFGGWHTENNNTPFAIMDRGGFLIVKAGVGYDLTFGNADDIPAEFVLDVFEADEGFSGLEDVPQRMRSALGTSLFSDGFESGDLTAWSSGGR